MSLFDPIFAMHAGGKIVVSSKIRLTSSDELSMAYTPGVAKICEAIAQNHDLVHTLTIKKNSVAVITDGTAVLGLGDIGPAAAMPVMEGKAMLFKEFAGIDAFPICLSTKDPDKIVETVRHIATGFGGINLEDISAPRCFDIERRLADELDIPVFHDDQHGTAIVVMAALFNALKVVGKTMDGVKVVICGAGAAGVACTRMMVERGIRHIIGCDRQGAIYRGRMAGMTPVKEWFAAHTNPDNERGSVADVLAGADVFIGLSAPGVITAENLKRMAKRAIVFAMANPTPEIMPEAAGSSVAIMATGRSDYPNQINNVLCFPGIFLGALRCRAGSINDEMKVAAADAIAGIVSERDLAPGYIVPSVFDHRVVDAVSRGVEEAARRSGVARDTVAVAQAPR